MTAAVVGAALLVPTAAAQQDEDTDQAQVPSSVVPSPFDLGPSSGEPPVDTPPPAAGASHTDDQDEFGPIVNHVHFDARQMSAPVWVEEQGRSYFFAGSLLASADSRGNLDQLAAIDGVDAFLRPAITYADGRLFVWGEIGIRQVNPTTLAVEQVWQPTFSSPTFPTGLGVTTTDLLLSTHTGGVIRIDRADGTQTGIGGVATQAPGIWHHESWGDSVLQWTGPEIIRYDASVTPMVQAGTVAGERLSSIASDGSILTIDDTGTVIRRRSGLNLALLSTTTLRAGDAGGGPQTARQAGLIFVATSNGTIDWYEEGGGRVGSMPGRGPFAVSDDGTSVYRTDSDSGFIRSNLNVATTGPHPTSVDQALFRPSWVDTITVTGWNLGSTETASIEGTTVPFTVLDPASDHPELLLDISALADRDGPVRVSLAGPRGTGTIDLPTRAPRGWAPLTLRSLTVDAPQVANESYRVDCGGTWVERGALDSGRARVILVPTLEECEARITTNDHQVRAGFIDPARPGDFADIWFRAPFLSGRPRHVLFVRRTEPAGPAFWLFSNPVGDAPDDVTYPFDVTCGTWSQRVTVLSGFGTRVQLPRNVSSTRCTARLARLRGAENVISHQVDRDGIVKSRDRDITFRIGSTRYLSFVIDHGGADLFAPVAVAAPKEDIGSRDNAGVVHIFPTSTDGRLRGGREQTLRQGRAGIDGPAEADDRFGEVVQAGDYNGDGWLDFAIGVPREDLGTRRNAGIVQSVYGTARGYRTGRTQTIHRDTPGVPGPIGAGDKFGDALAALDYDGDGYIDLAVGVPGEDLPGARNAGMVQIFFGSPTGLTTDRVEELTQGSPGFHTDPETGDRFGSALAGSGSLLAIGTPREDIRGRSNAGIIHVVDGLTGETIWDRQGGYTRDRDEAKDQFGSVLTMSGTMLAVGVPLEDDGSRKNVGIIHTYVIERPGAHEEGELRWIGGTTRTLEGTTGDRGGAGDKFGASVLIAPNAGNTGLEWLVVGVPGASVSGRDGAGEVAFRAVFNGQVFSDVIDQRTQVPGSPIADGAFGDQLLWGPWGSLVVSAPGLPVAGKPAAGRVFTSNDLETFFGVDQDTRGVGTKSERNAEFGAEIG